MKTIRAAIATLAVGISMSTHSAEPTSSTLPAFTHTKAADWLNSPPLTWNDLRGNVVLLEFWTFDCSNCRGSVAWIRSLEERFARLGLRIIGVHTPELPREYERDRVVAKVAEYRLTNPQMIDNDYSFWNAMGNQYWPAFYLVDKQGRLRAEHFGETHPKDRQAVSIESQIERLLAE
jgi:thiol-disulfide isomerase/thioredoxin